MANRTAEVSASRVLAAALLLASSMVDADILPIKKLYAMVAWPLACVSAGQESITLRGAFKSSQLHILMAFHRNLVLAAFDRLGNSHLATDSRQVLILPAGQSRHRMAAFKLPVLLVNSHHTPDRARITAPLDARMSTPFARTRARLWAIRGVVKQFRMALLLTSMATGKTIDAAQTTAPLWG
jgi:hypothetical protein